MPDTGLLAPTATEPRSSQLYPATFDEFIGQDQVRIILTTAVSKANERGKKLDHVLLQGPPGLGKTAAALLVTRGKPTLEQHGQALRQQDDFLRMANGLSFTGARSDGPDKGLSLEDPEYWRQKYSSMQPSYILLDEMEGMSKQGYQSLQELMDTGALSWKGRAIIIPPVVIVGTTLRAVYYLRA
ncbi:MAG: hypothetical protein V1724_09735 [Chloroflexota bacterium]